MIDFHSHFLPRMDDGSSSVEESLEMLRVSLDQGVDVMAATPHFYAFREDPDSFLERRAAAFARLPLEDAPHPKLLLGAEVYYFDGMSNSESLRRLTLEGTRYILIEMPFSRWSDHMVDEVLRLRDRLRLKPYLAHIERYLRAQRGTDYIERFLREGLLIQCNADFFLTRTSARKALRMLRNGQIHLLGSDAHNMAERAPELGDAVELIRAELGDGVLREMDATGQAMLRTVLATGELK
ncbi:MAG: capsular polysaccharide biosynthesis protein [Oscillospiraceae bacterium]|nr:capsular polysaccharide biosynthesis protein [Oscillospiraceae bacterium]